MERINAAGGGELLTDWEQSRLKGMPSKSLNAPSIGRNKSITITTNSLAHNETVRGPLAHEIGHHRLHHLHPLALCYLYLWPYLYYDREIVRHLEQADSRPIWLFWAVWRAVFSVLATPGWLAWVLIRLAWRTAEYDADRFACQVGAGYELETALRAHEKLRIEQRPKGWRGRIETGLTRIQQGRALGYFPLPNEHPLPRRRLQRMRRWNWTRRSDAGSPPEGTALRARRLEKLSEPAET